MKEYKDYEVVFFRPKEEEDKKKILENFKYHLCKVEFN